MTLPRIADLLQSCFREARVFTPQAAGAGLIETNVCRLDGAEWLVAGAGLGESAADDYFRGHPTKRSRALHPLRANDNGQLAFLFVIRPFDLRLATELPLGVAAFAPGNQMPYIEYRNGSFFRASNLDGGSVGVQHLRWELDTRNAGARPREEWLRKWAPILGCNPAHPTSHLHVNSPPLGDDGDDRVDSSGDDLRLAVAPPNPLALVLSFAAWLRAGPAS